MEFHFQSRQQLANPLYHNPQPFPSRKSCNKFIRCFHQFVSQVFFHKLFSVWAVEKGNKLLIGPKKVFKLNFSQLASWKRNHNIYSKIFRKLGIRDWWNYLMNCTLDGRRFTWLLLVFLCKFSSRLCVGKWIRFFFS